METSERTLILSTWPPEDLPAQQDIHPAQDLVEYVKNYAKEKPEMAALYCLMIGFVLGWKLKFW